jgi:uncharacterized protein YfaS (alpha-2-macroglobulin family)
MDTNPPAVGPYRTPSPPKAPPPPPSRWASLIPLLAVITPPLLLLLLSRTHAEPLGTMAVPAMTDELAAFPPTEPELPIAAPLAPLLAADAPEALSVLSPGEGAIRIRRGDSLSIRFNRPMVRGADVGRALAASPMHLTPEVAGTTRWVTRSMLSFTPAASEFDRGHGMVEAAVTFDETLASVDGETLYDETPRVIVLDGTPRLLSHESTAPVGAPMMLTFDAPVSTAELAREVLVYESGGGYRPLPVRVVSRGVIDPSADEPRYAIALTPSRALEPGAYVGIAIAPRWLSWGGSGPSVMSVQLEPRPRIDGLGCYVSQWDGTECQYEDDPGEIVEIESDLVLRTTHALGEVPASAITITPPVAGLTVAVQGEAPMARRLLAIHAEWEPDQVYEVRVGQLFTERGERLVAQGPLAIRSSGHPPYVSAVSRFVVLERGAHTTWPFNAINVGEGRVRRAMVGVHDEAVALLHPTTTASSDDVGSALADLAPTARPNRWGRGEVSIAHEGSFMEVVALSAASRAEPGDLTTATFLATDLGLSTVGVPGGVLVWVTSLATAQPVTGAEVELVNGAGLSIAHGTSGDDGSAWLLTPALDPLEADGLVVLARHDGDRAAMIFDARSAVGPATLSLTGGTGEAGGETRATVMTDRGAYRPEETLHALAIVRRVDGAALTRPGEQVVTLEVLGPANDDPVGVVEAPLSAAGLASGTFELPSDCALGDYRVVAMLHGLEIGAASATVAEYREPRFRVDLDAPADRSVAEGDALPIGIDARYLFGASVAGGVARYSVVRGGVVGHGTRWRQMLFAPLSAHAARQTLTEGTLDLDAQGHGRIDTRVSLGAPTRTSLDVEVEVTDESGEATTAHRTIIARPADVEVGLARAAGWIAFGQPLEVRAVALDATDEPVVGQALTARVVRESQQGYYEWEETDAPAAEGAPALPGGAFRLRRSSGFSVVHTCALRSAAEPVSCAFTPDRAGSYVLEIEARDAQGRVSLASQRVYVAGPDAAPDRDPPGAPIAVTPSRDRVQVGETAEVAFESPFEGEALVTVSTDRVISIEHVHVTPGGNTARVLATDAMVPNAFVSIAIVRPRTGPAPTAPRSLDLDAPDLRLGATEIRVAPQQRALTVAIEAGDTSLPGTEQPIDVHVTNADGTSEAGLEVALWVTDEGTLRLTDYQVPDETSGLFVRRAARIAYEDLRRSLLSLMPGALEPGPSGDGGWVDAPMQLQSRERYEPTPLFTTTLVTDASGHAHATVALPDRVTQYRIVAVAASRTDRFGHAERMLEATRPIVVRPALPRFLTEGDEVELAAFVHDQGAAPIDATVIVRAFGEEHTLGPVHVEAGADARVATRVTVPVGAEPTPIEIEARSGSDAHVVSRTLDVMPRGRWVRRRAFVMGVTGQRQLPLTFPAGTSARGAMRAVASLHPFIAADGLADDLAETWWSGGEIDAAIVLGLASHARLGGTLVLRDSESEHRQAWILRRLRTLAHLRTASGGYATNPEWASDDARLTIAVIRARLALHDAGIVPHDGAAAVVTDSAVDALGVLVRSGQVGASYGYGGGDRDLLSLALRTLALAGHPDEATFTREFDGRELLSPYALANLALATEEGDRRRDALVTLAVSRFHTENGPRYPSTDTRTLAAMLVACANTPAGHGEVADLSGELLRRAADGTASLSDPFATADVIDAFARVADRFTPDAAEAPALALDATRLSPAETAGVSARFAIPFADVVSGPRSLVARGVANHPVFLALDARWAEPLGPADDDARGHGIALHRVYETPAGAPIAPGAHVALGSLVRVRLYLHLEGSAPEWTAVRDPHPAGFEPVDTGLAATPQTEISSLVGMGPDDEVVDVRARRAMQTASFIRSHEHAPHASTYQLTNIGPGMWELTYAMRAATPGTYTAPPASVEALRDPAFVARSTAITLTVDP